MNTAYSSLVDFYLLGALLAMVILSLLLWAAKHPQHD